MLNVSSEYSFNVTIISHQIFQSKSEFDSKRIRQVPQIKGTSYVNGQLGSKFCLFFEHALLD